MISSKDLFLVTTLAKVGSLVGVSNILHISASAVSQRLTTIEDRLQIKIANRKGRTGIVLTPEGEKMVEQGAKILEALNELSSSITDQKESLSGKLHVIVSLGFGDIHVAPLISSFSKLHPNVSVALTLSDRLNKYPPTDWDIIIKVSPSHISTLGSHIISSNRRILCASPKYIASHGIPLLPDDLSNHSCISIYEDEEDTNLWRFTNPNGIRKILRIKPLLSTNSGEVAKSWAVSGAGLLNRSEWSVKKEIESGKLVEVMHEWSLPDAPIVAIINSKTPPIRSKCLMEYLTSMLNKELTIHPTR